MKTPSLCIASLLFSLALFLSLFRLPSLVRHCSASGVLKVHPLSQNTSGKAYTTSVTLVRSCTSPVGGYNTSLLWAFVTVQMPGWKECQLVITATRSSDTVEAPDKNLFYEVTEDVNAEFQQLFLASQATSSLIVQVEIRNSSNRILHWKTWWLTDMAVSM